MKDVPKLHRQKTATADATALIQNCWRDRADFMNTHIDRNLLGAMALLLCGVAGCGGGGGEQAPVPAPAPAPAPAPPGPPSVDSTKVSLTQLPSTCASGMGCLLAWSVLVDSSGEATAVWSEFVSTGSSRIVASNVPLGAAASSSSAVVESSFARPAVPNLIVRAVAPRKFAIFHQYGPNGLPANEPTHARVIQLTTSGPAIVEPQVTLPGYFQSRGLLPPVVQDTGRNLYGLLMGVVAPTPPSLSAALGGNVTLTGFALGPSPFATFGGDFYEMESSEPRAYFSGSGTLAVNGEAGVYVSQTRLTTGAIELPVKVAPPAVQTAPQFTCADEPNFRTVSTGAATYAIAWRQVKSAGVGCDLIVGGQKVNTSAKTVTTWAITGRGAEAVVVWGERDGTPTSPRVYWSRSQGGTAGWTAPELVAPQYSGSDAEQHLIVAAGGPDGTLATVWTSTAPGVANSSSALISKYHNGAWTTVSGGNRDGARAVAINGNGQGVALFRSSNCGSALCEEFYAVRF